jgi:hypothetical protein
MVIEKAVACHKHREIVLIGVAAISIMSETHPMALASSMLGES